MMFLAGFLCGMIAEFTLIMLIAVFTQHKEQKDIGASKNGKDN